MNYENWLAEWPSPEEPNRRDAYEADIETGREHDFAWRKLLWSNHARYLPFEHMPYGDDGEMQCCGIDFKRMSAKDIDDLLVRRALLPSPAGKPEGDAG